MSEKQEIFTLLNGRVTMARGIYNPTSDAVWLAAYTPTNVKTVLDVGIGTGGASLCVMARNPLLAVTGIDISEEMLAECRGNMKLNNRDINLVQADILKWSTTERFDVVMTNPPYFKGTPARHGAHHNADLDAWIKKSCARVNPNGYICVIVDSLCAANVMSILHDKHFGGVQLFPLFGAKHTAERVLIRAKQGSKTGSTIYAGTTMNNESILRDGLTIDALLSTLETL